MKKLLNYLKSAIEGDDGKFSAKRGLGVLCCIIGIILSIYSIFDCNCIPNLVLIIGALFTTSLAFFGITATQSYFTSANSNINPPTQESEK